MLKFFLCILIISTASATEIEISMTRDQQIEYAISHLSDRLDVNNLDDIELVSVRSITWPSGALGCPKPELAYTQALVPGSLILLKMDNKVYRYHAKLESTPFYCADKFAQQPTLPDRDL